MNIRELTAEELNGTVIDALAEKICGYYKNSTTLIDINVETVKKNWTGFIQSGMASIFIIEEESEIVGIISGVSFPDPLSGRIIAQEIFWYVDESCRYKGYGRVLINVFEGWAKLKGATAIRLAHLVDLRAKENQSLYEGLGYSVAEVTYDKEI